MNLIFMIPPKFHDDEGCFSYYQFYSEKTIIEEIKCLKKLTCFDIFKYNLEELNLNVLFNFFFMLMFF